MSDRKAVATVVRGCDTLHMLSQPARTLVVGLSRPEVGSLVAARLRSLLGDSVRIVTDPLRHLRPGWSLLTDDRGVTPHMCRQLVDAGHAVVILSALPSASAEQTYLGAGARAYLGMLLDFAPLHSVLRASCRFARPTKCRTIG